MVAAAERSDALGMSFAVVLLDATTYFWNTPYGAALRVLSDLLTATISFDCKVVTSDPTL